MKKLLFTLMVLLSVNALIGQAPEPKLWFGRLDLYHQDWLGDFGIGQLGVYDAVPIRPGFRLGVERTWIEQRHFRMYQDVLLGYYHNTYDEHSFTVGSDVGFEWRIFRQFRVALPAGLHFHRAKPSDIRYVYDGEKWVKAENTDPAISRLQFIIGTNIGWRFWPELRHPVEVFANGNISLIGPWQNDAGVPALMYKAAGIGIKIGL
jgi:hypothetical protein